MIIFTINNCLTNFLEFTKSIAKSLKKKQKLKNAIII